MNFKKVIFVAGGLLTIVAAWYVLAMLDLPFATWLTELQAEPIRGLVVYFGITLVAIVLAPLATLPLTVLAAQIWGWLLVAVVSIVAWQIGALINFWLARRFGRRLVGSLLNLQKLDQLTARLPQHEQFGTIFLLRMIFPVDLLSYALGLTKVGLGIYFWATLLGIIPFAFIWSYGGAVADSWQIVPVVAGGLLLFFGVGKYLRKKNIQ